MLPSWIWNSIHHLPKHIPDPWKTNIATENGPFNLNRFIYNYDIYIYIRTIYIYKYFPYIYTRTIYIYKYFPTQNMDFPFSHVRFLGEITIMGLGPPNAVDHARAEAFRCKCAPMDPSPKTSLGSKRASRHWTKCEKKKAEFSQWTYWIDEYIYIYLFCINVSMCTYHICTYHIYAKKYKINNIIQLYKKTGQQIFKAIIHVHPLHVNSKKGTCTTPRSVSISTSPAKRTYMSPWSCCILAKQPRKKNTMFYAIRMRGVGGYISCNHCP